MEGTAELFAGFAERIAREKGTQQEMMRGEQAGHTSSPAHTEDKTQ